MRARRRACRQIGEREGRGRNPHLLGGQLRRSSYSLVRTDHVDAALLRGDRQRKNIDFQDEGLWRSGLLAGMVQILCGSSALRPRVFRRRFNRNFRAVEVTFPWKMPAATASRSVL